MPMHGGAFGERVVDLDAQAVALAHAQHRARYLAVVGPYIRGGILARDELHARRPGSQAGLLGVLEPVTLRFGEVLHEPGLPITHVYFPVGCVVCLQAAAEGPEVGLIGYEGAAGISLALGVEVSSARALVQASGTALRIKAAHFKKALPHCPALQRSVYLYADAKLRQARQTIACNRFHAAEARLARWLLMTGDRARSDEFFLTQAFLAEMLGVRRATVNEAAGALQHRDLIGYNRGKLRILDRKGLEAAACRCYARLERASVRVRTDAALQRH